MTDQHEPTEEDMKWYDTFVEKTENIMVVLDDALEGFATLAERLAVIEVTAMALGVEADCLGLWQHVAAKMSAESGEVQ